MRSRRCWRAGSGRDIIGSMNRTLSATLAAAALLAVGAAPPADQKKLAPRCGWIVNPTPGNWWLTDRDGMWVMGSQGSEPVEGMDRIPDLTGKQWVRTNGYYGHGCGCITGKFDKAGKGGGHVLRIDSFRQKPLAACRSDKALPEP
jgi:hypothetical protein